MKTSRIAAITVTRLFFILLFLAGVVLYQGDSSKLQHLYLVANHKWIYVFPILLLAGFVTLFIYCTIKKYTQTDWNWVLVLNTLILLAYGLTLFIKVNQLLK